MFYGIGVYPDNFGIGVFLEITDSPGFGLEPVTSRHNSLNVFKYLLVESEEMSPSRFDMSW